MHSATCIRCGSGFGIGYHLCQSKILVTHPETLAQSRKEANPLDRLSFGEMLEIFGDDPDEIIEGAEVLITDEQEKYLRGPLAYRVELQTISGVGFQGFVDIWAIGADGSSDADLEKVLNFLNSDTTMIMSLMKDEVYLCRLVSVDAEGIKYVWSTKRLEFDSIWTINDWN